MLTYLRDSTLEQTKPRYSWHDEGCDVVVEKLSGFESARLLEEQNGKIPQLLYFFEAGIE